ncbi:hypothetical protein K469DRAFT_808680 [Zopfia rhizophila CBS 207.26]|uniref:Gfo/Idh/MocA-like oxidoreductase N-terminal domain-containing protein n=1 Tax=Zopfia rhizophila CBS 207.26 TaxID=1314779 RepID=A0A6A6EK35_9PEZI|nr:hypothetical protein K469DRAFT_808680 [Zopfia rhizophila CBS 207.26]
MLTSSCKPDVAIVCTPNHTHVSVSKELLDGGVHVLCEKPISVDIKHAASCKLHLLIGHHCRFNRYVLATKTFLPSLGCIIAINSAGPILINLIHEIDILHYLLGPIIREGAAITLKFASGAVGTFLLCDAVVSPHNYEAGTGENPTTPRGWNEKLECEKVQVPEMKIPFELKIGHFIRVINGQDAPSCPGEGLRALVICEAIRESLRQKRPADVPLENETKWGNSIGEGLNSNVLSHPLALLKGGPIV